MTNLNQHWLDTLGELLDVSVRVYRGAFRSLVLITALASLPSTLLTLAMILTSGGPAAPAPSGSGLADGLAPLLALASRATLGGRRASGPEQLVTFVLMPLMHGALIAATARHIAGAPVSVAAAYRLALGRAWALLGAHLLTTLLILVPLVPLLGVSMVLVLLVPPWLVFILTRLALSSHALMLEHRRPWASVQRSWHLTAGAFWRVLGYLVLVGLLGGVVGMTLPLSVTGAVEWLFPDRPWVVDISVAVATALTTVVITPFSSVASTVLYYALRARGAGGTDEMGAWHQMASRWREVPDTVE